MKTLDCERCEVRHLTLYGQIPGIESDTWSDKRHRVLSVPARRPVVQAGRHPGAYYVLRDGWAFRYLITSGGARQIVWFHLPGEALTPLIGAANEYPTLALTDCVVCVLEADAVLCRLARTCDALRNAVGYLVSFESSYFERIAVMGKLSAIERVANLLGHLQGRLALRGHNVARGFEFPLRNVHVADALGLSPVHVSRVFAELRARGVVARHDRRIRILDQAQLDELGRVAGERFLLPPAA